MQKYINKKKTILLVTVLALYLVIITPLLIINLQNKQELRGKAQIAAPTPTPTPVPSCVNGGSINGFVWNDGNNNKTYDTGESKLPGWNINLFKGGSTTPQSFTSDQTGTYNFTDLCGEGTYTGFTFDTAASGNTTPVGITYANGFLWVADHYQAKVYKYTTDGTYTGTSFDTAASGNDRPYGITYYNGFFWITDTTDALVYKYTTDGTYTGTSFDTAASGNAHPYGITYYNGFFWITGPADALVYKYTTDGTYTGTSFDTAASGNANPEGITYYNGFFWVVDELDTQVYKYTTDGTYTGTSFDTAAVGNVHLHSIVYANGFFWTVDDTENEVYQYTADGAYTVQEVLKAGWIRTTPINPNEYAVNIIGSNSITGKNFGNIAIPTSTPTPQPTATPIPTVTPTPTPNPTPATTFLDLTIYQHGIWSSGDNTNPDGSLSNKNPIHKTIEADLELYNTDNQLIGKGHGPLTYNGMISLDTPININTYGNYKGIIGIYPNTFPSGQYYLKVKTNFHLKRLVPGILTIITGQKNTVPDATLVTGDANNDNRLDILDYNLLLGCYSDLAPAISCDANKKTATDFNDDSFVNQFDYNLFLREIATQPGE